MNSRKWSQKKSNLINQDISNLRLSQISCINNAFMYSTNIQGMRDKSIKVFLIAYFYW